MAFFQFLVGVDALAGAAERVATVAKLGTRRWRCGSIPLFVN